MTVEEAMKKLDEGEIRLTPDEMADIVFCAHEKNEIFITAKRGPLLEKAKIKEFFGITVKTIKEV